MSDQHVLPLRVYLGVFGGLLGLTALTTWVAFMDFGVMNTVVAMTIAIVKALLVVLWFMHVRYSGRLVWIFAGAGALWLLFLFGLTMADYDTRDALRGWDESGVPYLQAGPDGE